MELVHQYIIARSYQFLGKKLKIKQGLELIMKLSFLKWIAAK
jgi:hypothetical protein